MTCLSGCGKVLIPKMDDHERCVVSIEFNKCRCHIYRVAPEFVGRVGNSYDKALNYCNNLVGFKPSVWVEYVLWFEEVFQAVDDANNKSLQKPDMETPEDILKLVPNG
jgi:hypothetical protein